MDRDRNLLFGIFAVQLGKVAPVELVRAGGAWATEPATPLARVLVGQGAMDEKDVRLIEGLVDEAIRGHDGDPTATLAAFGGAVQVQQSFQGSIIVTDSGEVQAGSTDSPPGIDGELIVLESPGRYSNKGEYARGGMGRVLLVHDEQLGRDVALKELLSEIRPSSSDGQPSPVGGSVRLVARFLQEARITGQLEHPSIVPVYELGRRADGSVYYTMKLVRGRTFAKAIVEAGSLEERLKLLPHFVDLCQAIAYAHSRGVIHRDIKPSNVMVGEFGETVVLDWGLAKARDKEDLTADDLAETLRVLNTGDVEALGNTVYGEALGTPAYMSPEQAKGQLDRIDERSDVYSLGAFLYELLTGIVPFQGTTLKETLEKVISEDPRPVGDLEPLTPVDIVSVCVRAMAKKPRSRYETAAALSKEIASYLTGGLVAAHHYSFATRFARFIDRNRAVVTTAVAATMILLALGVYSYIQISLERDSVVQARDAANNARDAADTAREIAEEQRSEAETQRGIAEERSGEAQSQRTLAEQRELEGDVLRKIAEDESARAVRASVDLAAQRALAEEERDKAVVERREAERQRGIAETNLDVAKSAVDELLTEISQNTLLTERGMYPLRRALLESAVRFYEDLSEIRKDDPELDYELAKAYMRLAETMNAGDEGDALLDPLSAGLDILERLIEQKVDFGSLKGAKVSLFVGQISNATGGGSPPRDMSRTIATAKRAESVFTYLAEHYADIPSFRASQAATDYYLSICYFYVGGGALALQYREKSGEHFIQALDAGLDPESVLYALYQTALRYSGMTANGEALEQLRYSVDLYERLVGESPENIVYRAQLARLKLQFAIEQFKAGTILGPEAIRAAREAVGELEKVFQSDSFPYNTINPYVTGQLQLARAYGQIGMRPLAFQALDKGIAAIERVRADAAYTRDDALSRSLVRLLLTKVDSLDSDEQRASQFDLCAKAVEELLAVLDTATHNLPDSQYLLSQVYLFMAYAYEKDEQPEKALEYNSLATEILSEFFENYPWWTRARDELFRSFFRKGSILLSLNDIEQGRAAYEQAVMVRRTAASGPDAGPEESEALISALNAYASAMKTHDAEVPVRLYKEARELIRQLMAGDPTSVAYHSRLSWNLNAAASVLLENGDPEQAGLLFEESLDVRRQLVNLAHEQNIDPKTRATYLGSLAWDLLTLEVEELRKPEEALKYAVEAVALTNESKPYILDTLALAYFRTGDTKEAVRIQEKAVSLLPPVKLGEKKSPNRIGYEGRLEEFKAALTSSSQ